jgi:hypothetical protein
MESIWPWLAVAGVGALHGLNPASGWLFAAASGVRSRDRSQALRSLLPIAIGHATAMTLVAGTFAIGMSINRALMQVLAGGLLVVLGICHLSGHKVSHVPTKNAGLALWSFIMSSAHGAGLMLMPVLMPLCTGNTATREIASSGSLSLVLAAVGIHTAAMIAVTGAITMSACRGFDAGAELLRSFTMYPRGKG